MNFPRLTLAFTVLSRYAYIITLTLVCAILSLLVWFLYAHVYQTLTQAELVVELKGHISTQTLQVEQHQNVLERIKAKSASITPIYINNTVTSTSTASTTVDQRRNPFQGLK